MVHRRSVRSLAPALLTLVILLGACSSGDSSSDATTSPSFSSDTTADGDASPPDPTMIASNLFTDGGPIPVELTCDGSNSEPSLEWSGLAQDVVSVALIVDDIDAPGGSFVHWNIVNIGANASGISPAARPVDLVQGENDAGATGWTGPCPPPGDGPHTYVFSLFALSEPLDLGEGASPDEVRDALDAVGAAEVATLTGTYER